MNNAVINMIDFNQSNNQMPLIFREEERDYPTLTNQTNRVYKQQELSSNQWGNLSKTVIAGAILINSFNILQIDHINVLEPSTKKDKELDFKQTFTFVNPLSNNYNISNANLMEGDFQFEDMEAGDMMNFSFAPPVKKFRTKAKLGNKYSPTFSFENDISEEIETINFSPKTTKAKAKVKKINKIKPKFIV